MIEATPNPTPKVPGTKTMRKRYKAVSTGFWSFIVDRTTNKVVSHGYDLLCDAEYYADEKNREWRAEMRAANQRKVEHV